MSRMGFTDAIEELARSSGKDRRSHAFMAATELYASTEHHENLDQYRFAELAKHLYLNLSLTDRCRVSNLLSTVRVLPESVVELILNDSSEIGLVLLKKSSALQEWQLLKAANKGLDQRRALSQRDGISPDLAQVMLSFRELEIAEALAIQSNAVLNATATGIIVELAAHSPSLLNALIRRKNIDRILLLPYFFSLDTNEKQIVIADLVRTTPPIAPARRLPPGVITSAHIQSLEKSAFEGLHDRLTTEISKLLSISRDRVSLFIRDDGGEAFVAICRLLTLDEAQTIRLLLHGPGAYSKSSSQLERLQKLYRILSEGAAARLLDKLGGGENPTASSYAPHMVTMDSGTVSRGQQSSRPGLMDEIGVSSASRSAVKNP